MQKEGVNISQINHAQISKERSDEYVVCWIKNEITGIEIAGEMYTDVSNSVLFIDHKLDWKILKPNDDTTAGYILHLSKKVLDTPILRNLHINQVRLFNSNEIPLFKLSPGIEKRTQAILEMIDELLGSNLNHKDEAILSLLNTFFVYCDGRCNIHSIASNNNTKSNIVYKFKKTVDEHILENHEVGFYADSLHISPKYLNECVQEVLNTSAKSILIEQLLMRARHALKFSDQSIKEISFMLGFSSPDYFSAFFKNHTGQRPSELR